MKINKLLLGFGAIAALAMTACSNDDSGVVNPENNGNSDGATAYMAVSINTATASRAQSEDDDFEYGVNEQAVDNANFYFYTAEGAYVTTAQVWDGGTTSTANPTENIEFRGKTVLVLKDLNEANAPAYIVTVLNAPTGFTPGATLAEMEANLALATADADGYAYVKDATTYYTMSTSSYVRTDPANAYEYFTTKVENSNFLKYDYGTTPTQAQIDELSAVEIYVERLAVQVRVKYGTGDLTNKVEVGGKTYFKLTVSGGNVTNTEDGSVTIPVADVDLYLAIEGWGLNNLTQNSYMMKNFGYADDNTWHTSTAAVNNFRNYWAKAAPIYGKTDPAILAHYSLNDHMTGDVFNKTVGTSDFCFENTNTAAVLKEGNNLGNLATSAMIYARIYQRNGDTMTPATMVSYNGIMFTDADFKAMVLSALQNNSATGALKFAHKVGSEYKTIAADDIEISGVAGSNKGEITIKLTTAASDYTWYSYTGATLPTEDTGYATSSAEAVNNAIAAIIANSMGTDPNISTAHAYEYKGGLMYYNVPIEHYRNSTGFSTKSFEEGDYGVVRNHIYDLSITGVTKLGKAIYDPDQVIIPDTPTDEDRYALGVKVNILSWKIVTQNVPL